MFYHDENKLKNSIQKHQILNFCLLFSVKNQVKTRDIETNVVNEITNRNETINETFLTECQM
jgi:hypothetical protein